MDVAVAKGLQVISVNIADLFCGAGGTSTGAVEAIESLGFSSKLTAINHWPVAIATHTKNHPSARHFCVSIDDVNPKNLFKEGELDVLWASPECTHHSTARGGKPINDQSRATAWCVTRWAETLRPKVILVENVPEFETWGGIGSNGRPLKNKKGETFQAWISTLRSLGYRVDYRVLCAADYGDPTTRRRLFVQAVRGRFKNVWPDATHAPTAEKQAADLFGAERKPWVPARDIIDWSIPGTSIYERKRPLSPKTMKRIMDGLAKFGIAPSIVTMEHGGGVRSAERPLPTITCAKGGAIGVVMPHLLPQQAGGALRPVSRPVPTVSTDGAIGLIEPFILPQHGSNNPRSIHRPAPTVTTTSRGVGLVEPFIVEFYGTGRPVSVSLPLGTATTKARFGLARPEVIVDGERRLLDIRFRMLQPHELAAAQGFRGDYRFTGTKTEQVKQIGNAVPRRLARALCAAVLSQNSNVSNLLT